MLSSEAFTVPFCPYCKPDLKLFVGFLFSSPWISKVYVSQEEEDACDGLVVQLQREMSAAQRDTERFYARLMELKREHAAHVRSVAREYNSERYADSEPDTEPRSILKTRQPGRTTQVRIVHKIY